jgi:hypothetical protein
VVLRFTRKAKRALSRASRLTATLGVAATDAAGNSGTAQQRVSLRR